jgi:hypothetical protein
VAAADGPEVDREEGEGWVPVWRHRHAALWQTEAQGGYIQHLGWVGQPHLWQERKKIL